MALSKEERRLLHQKSKQATFGTQPPQQHEGKDGDRTFRDLAGTGTVMYYKRGDNWVPMSSTNKMPAQRIITSGAGSDEGAGVTAHADLTGLDLDHHLQYLLHDGTRELTANWDAGTFTIQSDTIQADTALSSLGTLDVDGATTLDQVTIDTADGAFSVDGTNGTTINSTGSTLGFGDDADAFKISIGGDTSTRTEVELNAILIDINAGTGGTKIGSDGVIEIDSTDSTRFKMEANVTGNRTLKIEAANSHLTGFGNLDIDADGGITITAVGTLDIDSSIGAWDATKLSIDSTDTTNISMNANAAGDKTLTIDAENAGLGNGLFELNADIITFNTPYVATSDENQTNAIGSWNFTTNDDLSFYSNGTDTWINASDNYLKLYSAFDMYFIVDGEQLYIQDTSTNTVYTFDVGATPALTVLANDLNGAPFLIENEGIDGDIKLKPMGGDLYIQSSGGDNTFRFNARGSTLTINNKYDDTLDPKIIFTNDDTGDDWSMGIDVGDVEDGYDVFKIHSTTTLAGTGDFELNTSGDGRFRGDLYIEGNDLEFGNGATIVNTSVSILEATGPKFHFRSPYSFSSVTDDYYIRAQTDGQMMTFGEDDLQANFSLLSVHELMSDVNTFDSSFNDTNGAGWA